MSLIVDRIDTCTERLHIFNGRPQQLLARYLNLSAKAFKLHVKQCHSASHSAASHAAAVIACNLCNALISSGDIDAENCAQLLHKSALKAGWDVDDTAAFARHRILIQSNFALQFASVNLEKINELEVGYFSRCDIYIYIHIYIYMLFSFLASLGDILANHSFLLLNLFIKKEPNDRIMKLIQRLQRLKARVYQPGVFQALVSFL